MKAVQAADCVSTGLCACTPSWLQVDEVIRDYYKRLQPRDAAVLVKELNSSSKELQAPQGR